MSSSPKPAPGFGIRTPGLRVVQFTLRPPERSAGMSVASAEALLELLRTYQLLTPLQLGALRVRAVAVREVDQLRRDVPPQLAAAVARMLATTPADRPAGAAEAAEELAAFG